MIYLCRTSSAPVVLKSVFILFRPKNVTMHGVIFASFFHSCTHCLTFTSLLSPFASLSGCAGRPGILVNCDTQGSSKKLQRHCRQMVLRRGAPLLSDSSSSDEEDAFSALARKGKKSRKSLDISSSKELDGSTAKEDKEHHKDSESKGRTSDGTSSTKRHHHMSSARQAKMEALLQELKSEKSLTAPSSSHYVPEKKGSFVPPGEEHLTTNVFVGNLAPSVTEEQLTEAFRQFGEKIL